ncbi:MAG: ATP-binding cassette domain-containing protein, partial [Betaproteobacteria bacterium]|nr:ATP-binding cassette domain-containing protein [Betaproteobacteria bacterium]
MSSPLLEVRDLRVHYGGIEAVRGISLAVHAGESVAIIGANGAGKTSVLKAITGLVSARRGTILFDGQDITGLPGHLL